MVALCESYPLPAEILAICEQRSSYMGVLRRAMRYVRDRIVETDDWVEFGIKDQK